MNFALPLTVLPALSGELAGREFLHSRIGDYAAIRSRDYRLTTHVSSGVNCELFDLAGDPEETRNLVDDPARQALATAMRDRLLAHETAGQ